MTLTGSVDLSAARRARNDALVRADLERAAATFGADVEYSEALLKLQHRCEVELSEAATRHREATAPAQRAYNHAVREAERRYAETVNAAPTT